MLSLSLSLSLPPPPLTQSLTRSLTHSHTHTMTPQPRIQSTYLVVKIITHIDGVGLHIYIIMGYIHIEYTTTHLPKSMHKPRQRRNGPRLVDPTS